MEPESTCPKIVKNKISDSSRDGRQISIGEKQFEGSFRRGSRRWQGKSHRIHKVWRHINFNTVQFFFQIYEVQWGSEKQTRLVFEWSKIVV